MCLKWVVYLDNDLRIKWANQAAGESLGECPPDLRGRYCFELWQGRDTPCEDCSVMRALDTGRPHEHEIATPDGRHWHVRACPVHDEEGRITGAVEVTRDITERKRTDALLARERAALNNVIDRNPYSIMLFNGDGSFVRSNQACRTLFKCEPPPGYCFFEDPVLNRMGQHAMLERVRQGEAVEIPALWYNPHELSSDLLGR